MGVWYQSQYAPVGVFLLIQRAATQILAYVSGSRQRNIPMAYRNR